MTWRGVAWRGVAWRGVAWRAARDRCPDRERERDRDRERETETERERERERDLARRKRLAVRQNKAERFGAATWVFEYRALNGGGRERGGAAKKDRRPSASVLRLGQRTRALACSRNVWVGGHVGAASSPRQRRVRATYRRCMYDICDTSHEGTTSGIDGTTCRSRPPSDNNKTTHPTPANQRIYLLLPMALTSAVLLCQHGKQRLWRLRCRSSYVCHEGRRVIL